MRIAIVVRVDCQIVRLVHSQEEIGRCNPGREVFVIAVEWIDTAPVRRRAEMAARTGRRSRGGWARLIGGYPHGVAGPDGPATSGAQSGGGE